MNAIRYVLRTGCAWRLLPHDLPPWQLVYHYFWVWRRDGAWQEIHDALPPRMRRSLGRNPTPSGAVTGSQSVRTTEKGARGYDAGKRVMGRKRHIVVDTQGLLLAVAVHPADVQDRDGARLVLRRLMGRFPRLELIWAGGACGGQLARRARETGGWTLELVRKPAGQRSFRVLPRRWVVERTFAWLGKCRRLSKDYEALPETTEAWVYAAMTGLMLRRLARSSPF